jgi:phage shock protein A
MFKRLANLMRGFLSIFISGLEKANPQAMIEAEKENLRTQIARFNESLTNHAGFIERLIRQVKTLESKERELTAKIAAYIKAGNRAVAGQMAMELQTVKSQLTENRGQLVAAEETYKKLIKTRDISVTEAHAKIEKLKRMISEAQMLEAQAELQEMAQGMIAEIGTGGDTLNRVEEYLTERRDQAAGRARVAAGSIDIGEVEMKASEQTAMADQALAEFEMAYGMTSAPAQEQAAEEALPVQPETIKDLGPQGN